MRCIDCISFNEIKPFRGYCQHPMKKIIGGPQPLRSGNDGCDYFNKKRAYKQQEGNEVNRD